MTGYRGRFAPSPTGLLHLGSAATALVAAARAQAAGGALLLRVEDLDTPRVVAGVEAEQLDDLRWLGVRWDEGPDVGGPCAPYRQSARGALYEAALDLLAARDLTYLCDCSRAEIAHTASAPHGGEEGPRYGGTCRQHGMKERAFRRPPAVRLKVSTGDAARIRFTDAVLGAVEEDVSEATGDFVLRRGDGVFSYQLAVVVDDLAMGITEVVRGADLVSSTARQILLARLLGGTAPAFAHLPLVVGPGGERLAKRAPGMTLRDQRMNGRDPASLVAALARVYGAEMGPGGDAFRALASRLDGDRLDLPRTIDALSLSRP